MARTAEMNGMHSKITEIERLAGCESKADARAIIRKSEVVPKEYKYSYQDQAFFNRFFADVYVATVDTVRALLCGLGIDIRLNLLSGRVEVSGLPKQFSRTNAVNTVVPYVADLFRENERKCSRQLIEDAVTLISDERRYNPIQIMLTAEPHDGQDRLHELHHILGIAQNTKESTYLRKWLLQCVALALNDEEHPVGSDGVLVLCGEQGVGKTRFLRTLAMRDDWFFEGASLNFDRPDSIIQTTGAWLCELGELDSTLKREQSALKAFLTSGWDTYRLPYARSAIRRPRRTSFCASVNGADGFLNDPTGNRRFWTISVDRIDLEALNRLNENWLAQLWRQVYAMYLQDMQGFRLTPVEREALSAGNARFEKSLPYETEVRDSLDWDQPVEKWMWFTSTALKNYLPLFSASAEQVGRVLQKLTKEDERIRTKSPGHTKQYLVPPRA